MFYGDNPSKSWGFVVASCELRGSDGVGALVSVWQLLTLE